MPRLVRPLLAALTVAAMAGALACDDSPTTPSADLSGTWTGTWEFRTAGATVTDNVTATLTQAGANAAGTWTAQSGPTGQLNLSVGDRITGTFTIAQTMFTGQVCSGTADVQGSASSSALDFSVGQVPSSGVCQWGSDIRFSFRR